MNKEYSELTMDDFYKISELEFERLLRAEEFCWTFNLGVSLGMLDDVPVGERNFFADVFEEWNKLAVETGIMPTEPDEEYEAGPVPGYML